MTNSSIDQNNIAEWMTQHKIDEVECLIPDMTGIMRGKTLSAQKFLDGLGNRGLRIPEAIFTQTVTGDFLNEPSVISQTNLDILMVPDIATLRIVPWITNPTAQIICDAQYMKGDPVDLAPRQLLRHILSLYEQAGLRPIVAPELEFYLVARNTNPDFPLEKPEGLSGRAEAGRQAYGIEAANQYDPIINALYDFCEKSRIDIDTTAHEAGAAQIEMNFNHGDPLELADQVFLFKRATRQAALAHGVYATFMAKPHQFEPGSAMHIHQSIVDIDTGDNIFSLKGGRNSAKLMQYVGGLQRFIPAMMPLFAANVNSYRRLVPDTDAPINVHWGHDNRTVGLRIPDSDARSRRIENRVPGADCNPYLAFAGTLACGLLGLQGRMKPMREIHGSANRLAFTLPRSQHEALHRMKQTKAVKMIL
ncbi:MAG: glutamine synthetase family protein, partial [Pseudomonadota bacterium]